jgi:trimeric autotransporter adhesin
LSSLSIFSAKRTITNVAAGRVTSTSTDAINGSQLYATNQAINNAINDSSAGSVKYDVYNGVTNYNSVTLQGSTYNTTTHTGGTKIINVADGSNASDAVNYSQLSNVSNFANSIYLTGTKYFHANSTGADSQALGVDSVAIGTGAIANNSNDIALGSFSTTDKAIGTAGATIAGQNYDFAGATPFGTLSAGSAGHERTITNVAAGRLSSSSTDAVNGSQLYATNQAVNNLSNSVTDITIQINQLDSAAVKYDKNSDGSTNYNSVTLGDGTNIYDSTTHEGGTTVTNVAYGKNNSDAVNVQQLNDAIDNVTNVVITSSNPFFAGDGNRDTEAAVVTAGTHGTAMGAASTASGMLATAVGSGATASASNSVALGAGSVADRDNTVSVGTVGGERQIVNVAAGTQGTDAVNLNQLNDAVINANTYTDQKVNVLSDQISSVARNAYSGVAAASALAMIPDVDLGKTIAVGVGTANYKGYQATALGASVRITQNVKMKIGAGYSAAGTTVGAGASYQW